jgi:Periplasmic binding protein
MKNAGVKIVFMDSMAESYAAAFLKDLTQQNFHPVVVLGAATYTNSLVKDAGGAAAVNGDYLEQNTSLYLGQDAKTVPAVATFLHWVNVASPGFKTDLYTLYAWLSTELFAQALKNAGANPSRGSELQALNKITTFDGNHIVAPNNPVTKAVGNCYLIAKVVNGQFVRTSDDPPVTGTTHGYRCDYSYINPPSS